MIASERKYLVTPSGIVINVNEYCNKHHITPQQLEILFNKENKYIKSKARQYLNPPALLPFEVYKNYKYPKSYNYPLRKKIRNRDDNRCQHCGIKGSGYTLEVHHINFNKKDCSESNLITLCKPCHKLTFTDRDYWYRYYWYRMNPS